MSLLAGLAGIARRFGEAFLARSPHWCSIATARRGRGARIDQTGRSRSMRGDSWVVPLAAALFGFCPPPSIGGPSSPSDSRWRLR